MVPGLAGTDWVRAVMQLLQQFNAGGPPRPLQDTVNTGTIRSQSVLDLPRSTLRGRVASHPPNQCSATAAPLNSLVEEQEESTKKVEKRRGSNSRTLVERTYRCVSCRHSGVPVGRGSPLPLSLGPGVGATWSPPPITSYAQRNYSPVRL